MKLASYGSNCRIIALIILGISIFNVSAQIDTAWISSGLFPNANASSATVVKVDQSGNIFSSGTAGHNFVMKQNAEGEVLWLQTYDCGDTIAEAPGTLCIDGQGNAYITFMKHKAITGGSYWAIAIQKYDATNGAILWTTELADSQFNGYEWQVKPKYMTIDNNYIYVAGTKFEPGTSIRDILTMKLDFYGNILWTATHSGNGTLADYSNAKSITVDVNGNVYVAGDAWNASIDYCVVKFDSDGNLVWDAFYDGQIYNSTDIAQSIKIDSSGNVYITGYNQISENTKDIVTVKFNLDGIFQWSQNYGNPEYRHSNAYFIDFDEQENVYVGGYSAYENPYPGTGKDYILLKYDPSGNLLWDARFDHFNYIDDHPYDFAKGPDGNIYVCGTSIKSCFPQEFITVVKYNPQGEEVYVFNIPGLYGIPWGIDVSGDNEFVVAGAAIDSNYVKHTTTFKCVPGPPSPYNNDILNIFFEQQITPPVIDFENHTIIATVHDSANLQFLVPYMEISDYACMYPSDEDTTSFLEPVWYNLTSFDNVEQWWIVHVEGGTVGQCENPINDFLVYPIPTKDKFKVRCSMFGPYSYRDEQSRIELLDMFGKQVALLFEGKVISDQMEFYVRNLHAGVYYCRLTVGKHSQTKKMIIK